jgi:hypothetical protein
VSSFQLVFDVSQTVAYDLVSANLITVEYYEHPNARAQLRLSGGPLSETIFEYVASWPFSDFGCSDCESGLLLPGRYVLEADAQSWGYLSEGYFSFDLMLIPEPSTALLVGLGCLLLAGARRRATASPAQTSRR